jgi:hypothetical protein
MLAHSQRQVKLTRVAQHAVLVRQEVRHVAFRYAARC